MRDIQPSAAVFPSAPGRGDGARMLGIVLVGAGASLPLAALVLASGGGLLTALLAYACGGSALSGAAAGLLAARDSRLVAQVAARARRAGAAPRRRLASWS
jgi:hypothetical protein